MNKWRISQDTHTHIVGKQEKTNALYVYSAARVYYLQWLYTNVQGPLSDSRYRDENHFFDDRWMFLGLSERNKNGQRRKHKLTCK